MTERTWRRWVRVGAVLGAVSGCGPEVETTTEGSTTGDSEASDPSSPTDPSSPSSPSEPTDPSSPSDPTDPGDPTEGSDTDPTNPDPTGPNGEELVALGENRDVDILFVIDNSGSMGATQARLSQGLPAFVDELQAADANYRIGVTTTDSGNPRCAEATFKPEGGKLVRSSCIDRIAQEEFAFNGEDFSFACTDLCNKSDAELTVIPTLTAQDGVEKPRNWVERIEGQSNIGGVAGDAEALQCYLPQGVAGCGFESHLESMFLALAGSTVAASASNFGFLREHAQLAVVFVSDETDCSWNPATKEIFTTNKVFWNDPADVAPNSAVCWRAGVGCSGDAPTFTECHAENHDITGAPGADNADAVLHPVSKYVEFVKAIEAQKQNIDPGQRVKISLIDGVPVGYEDFSTELVYEDSADQEFKNLFGIGPGCVLGDPGAPEFAAVPPVREREFAEAFAQDDQHRPLYSICQNDYSDALAAIAEEITADIQPLCMPTCVRDTEPENPTLEPNCTVQERDINNVATDMQACAEVNGEWMIPAGQTACFGLRIDPAGDLTPSKLDDMSPWCVDGGFNLEFVIKRSAPKAPGTFVSATCELSNNKKKDCPLL